MDVNAKTILISSILSLAVTGCGGGSGGSASPSTAKSSDKSDASISGAVADGYLYGATVCLDMNDNKLCDQGEPTATSGNNGQYTLLNVNAEDAEKHGVVVEVSATTIDEDTGSAVGKSYVLTSPPGKYAFVSPLSTLVHTTMDMLKTTESDAEQVVKQNMVFDRPDISLFKDYIKAANEAPYQQLHKIAQIAAYILGQNHQSFNEAVQRDGLDADEQSVAVHNLLVQHVFSQLVSIKAIAAAKVDNSAFTEVELAALDVELNTTNIKNRLEKETEVNAATTNFDIKNVFEKEGGLSSIDKYDCDKDCTYENDTITLSVNDDLTYDWEHTQKAYQSGAWSPVPTTNYHWDRSDILVDGEWAYHDAKKTGSKQTEVASNQVALMPLEVISYIQLDITDKKIVPFLASSKNLNISEDIVREVAGSNAAFGSGAKAYLSSVMASADIYQVSLDNDFDSCVGTTIPWIDETTNCNNVTSGDPREELLTLEALFSNTNDKEIHASKYAVTLNRENAGSQRGTAKISLNNSSSSSINSTWEIRDASPGITIVAIQIPAKMKKLDGWYDFGQTEVFFTVIDGYLRAGEFTPIGAVTEWTGYEFNSVAMDNILDQFNL
ncbi:hypothetical protein [Alkalimarinus alittae]|uniref:Lipoprotein n=1 Tax=Alkalimarinus alittae TaxID=2961619 RepID=A0ABY6N3F5_9ALTE|nr:hypothetical protein [Alkalimarinus alittae]UZE96638.1 hypothetical protein NKI27_02480 [Alkalimarinus alittae]